MCRHYWLLDPATREGHEEYGGIPGRCKRCGERRVFCDGERTKAQRREPGNVLPPQVGQAQMPFNPHGHEPRLSKRGLG